MASTCSTIRDLTTVVDTVKQAEKEKRMKANELVKKLGNKLLGKKVNTPALGEYPGGLATVIQIAPDQNAPEIAFSVSLASFGPMGVFEYEEVSLLTDGIGVIHLHEHWRN